MLSHLLRPTFGLVLAAALLPLAGCSNGNNTENPADAPTPPVVEPGPATDTPAAAPDQSLAPPNEEEPVATTPVTEPEAPATVQTEPPATESPVETPAEPVTAEAPRDPPALPATVPGPGVTLVEEVAAMPNVAMSAAHAATCRVKVGDTFPAMTLPNASGDAQDLNTLRGPKLTVVVLWQAGNPYSVWELKRVGELVAMPLSDAGVSVVAINVGDPAELAKQTASATTNDKVAQLLDEQRAGFEQLATGRLPRTFLLDAAGKVLWLDLEYSQDTERSLMQAVHFALQNPGG